MTEDELLASIIDLAHLLGARVAHFRPAKTARGWRTPIQGDGKGFPDCVIVTRDHRVLFRELKSEKGKCSIEQMHWFAALSVSADTATWTPRDWFDGTIRRELSPASRGAA